jgi:integrase
MVETKLLTDPGIRKLKPGAKLRWIRDSKSQSLYLVIAPRRPGGKGSKGSIKSFMMRFRDRNGRPAKMVLGRFLDPRDLSGHEPKDTPEVRAPLSLAEARALAADIHRRRARGEDVIGDHKGRKIRERTAAATKEASTFMACAIDYVREHRVERFGTRPRRWFEAARALGLAWPRHGDPDKVEPEIMPGGLAERWADKPVTEIDEADILAAVDGLPKGTQRRLLTGLSGFFRHQHAQRHVLRNPCRDLHRPAPPIARDRVLSPAELRWLWRALDDEPIYGPLVKLLMLTGQRRDEAAGIRVSELSGDRATWTIPGTRTKNHRTHVVALAPLAQEQLAGIAPRPGSDLFFSTAGTTPVSGWSRLKRRLDRKMAELAKAEGHKNPIQPWKVHDLRRVFVTYSCEIGIRPDVVELTVNHASGRANVAGVYNRSQLLEERRQALARWALHLAGIVEQRPANVAVLAEEAKARRV